MKFYFALRREGEALASSSPSPSTFRRAQRPRPPSLHRRPTSSTPGMTKKRPVGVWLKPQGQENDDTTRVKREQQDRAPAPTTCTPARPTRRDRAWHAQRTPPPKPPQTVVLNRESGSGSSAPSQPFFGGYSVWAVAPWHDGKEKKQTPRAWIEHATFRSSV